MPLDVLAQQEFLLTERGMSYRDALDQRLAARGLAIHPYIELGSASLLCQMVERGMGLSFLPEYIVCPGPSPPGVWPVFAFPTAPSPCTVSCSTTRINGLRPR